MNVFNELYYTTIAKNDHNLKFWEDNLKNLRDLDFSVYSDKLKVPALIPVGNRILFRGEIKHTNEVTVALGQGYFVKCSAAQAEVLKQRRIKDAEEKVEQLKKEKDLLENRLYYSKETLSNNVTQEIIEPYNEEEDRIWREKHKQRIKKFKQKERKYKNSKKTVTDEELNNRLEELELQEELQNELQKLSDKDSTTQKLNKKKSILKSKQKSNDTESHIDEDKTYTKETALQELLELEQDIEDRYNELKIQELQDCTSENDLIKKLEHIEQLENLEVEMYRLQEILKEKCEVDKSSEESDPENPVTQKIRRSVSFAEDYASETIEITFEHTNVKQKRYKYDPAKGFIKPSDIYEAYPHLFEKETTMSILKNRKYSTDAVKVNNSKKAVQFQREYNKPSDDLPERSTVVVKNIVEKSTKIAHKESKARPASLFKLRRQQRKNHNVIK